MAGSFRQRFAAFRGRAEPDGPPPKAVGRSQQPRLQLRLPPELLLKLQLIKLAEGVAKNRFCEAVIAQAAEKRLAELRGQFDEATWNVIVRAAEASWRQDQPG